MTPSEQPFETHTDDGFYSCGSLKECKATANRLAAQGTKARVYRASDTDASLSLVYTATVKD